MILSNSVFSKFKLEPNLEKWDGFPELMWDLGFEMDCEKSFAEAKESCGLNLKEAHTRRENYRNELYILENSDTEIVGNYLLSVWRYWTHWACSPYDEYELDFIRRIISILEDKLSSQK